MIKDVLRNLTPEVETIENPRGRGGEESSSTPEEDDNKGGNSCNEEQTEVSPENRIEHQVVVRAEEQAPIQNSNLE